MTAPLFFQPKTLSYEDVRKEAEQFLSEYHGTRDLPVPIESIVEFDLRVDVIPVLGLEQEVGVAGFLASDLEHIYVDKQTFENSVERYRFTLAHEVGHYWLHDAFYKQVKIRSIDDFKKAQNAISNGYRWFEFQANSFAGLVLVPVAELRECFDEFSEKALALGISIDQLVDHPMRQRLVQSVAQRFKVSEPVAGRRLEKDGLLPELARLD